MSGISFTGRAASGVGPATALRPVSPDDLADLPDGPARSLFVGGAGLVAVEDASGARAVIDSAAHQYHPVQIRRVLATGTTATGLLALY